MYTVWLQQTPAVRLRLADGAAAMLGHASSHSDKRLKLPVPRRRQVAHHLFSAMPHYRAREATAVLKPLLGPYYQFDARSPARALAEDWLRCSYVAPDPIFDPSTDPKPSAGVMWYRSLPLGGAK